jgi:hypothetical protein
MEGLWLGQVEIKIHMENLQQVLCQGLVSTEVQNLKEMGLKEVIVLDRKKEALSLKAMVYLVQVSTVNKKQR